MAHRGKVYPVVFRRDFNLNVNTFQRGLARRYSCKFPPITFNPPNNLVGLQMFADESTVSPADTLHWSGGPFANGGQVFHLELTCRVDRATSTALRLLTVSELSLGNVYIWRYGLDPATDHGSMFQPPSNLVFYSPAFFTNAPVAWVPDLHPAVYGE